MERKRPPEQEDNQILLQLSNFDEIVEEKDSCLLDELIENLEIIRNQLSASTGGQAAMFLPLLVSSIPTFYRFLLKPLFFLLYTLSSPWMAPLRLPIICLIYFFRNDIIKQLLRLSRIVSISLSNIAGLQTPLESIPIRLTHENPAENFNFAWLYIEDSVEAGIARSNELNDIIIDTKITTAEVIDQLEVVRSALQTIWEDSYSRLTSAIQILHDKGHIDEEKSKSFESFVRTSLTNRIRTLLKNVKNEIQLLEAQRNSPFSHLLPLVNDEIQLIHRTLTHIFQRMNSLHNEVISRARQVVPQKMYQMLVTDEIRDDSKNFVEATQEIRYTQRFNSLKRAIEQRIEEVNNTWVSQSRQEANDADKSHRVLQQLKSLYDQHVNNEPIMDGIESALEQNEVETAIDMLNRLVNVMNETKQRLNLLKTVIDNKQIKNFLL